MVRSYLTESDVQARLGIDSHQLTRWREGRKVLAVWHQPVEAWLYPDFQFDHEGLIKEMPEILATFDRYYSHVWENTWMVLEWFFPSYTLLDGRRPLDVIRVDPSRVLEAARIDLWENPETMW